VKGKNGETERDGRIEKAFDHGIHGRWVGVWQGSGM
jgi:hypothetical protein